MRIMLRLQPSTCRIGYLKLTRLACITAFVLLIGVVSNVARVNQDAARRDHLTTQEADLVREAQRIDQRVEVFIKTIDRRMPLLAPILKPAVADQKTLAKDTEKLGAVPSGTTADLLDDIARILDEAITNIDDVSEHKKQQELLPKALRKLSQACERYVAQLASLRATADAPTRLALERAIENAQAIIDAAGEVHD